MAITERLAVFGLAIAWLAVAGCVEESPRPPLETTAATLETAETAWESDDEHVPRETLARLAGNRRLQTLILRNARLGDEDLAVISGAVELKELVLPAARIGDRGLRHLASLVRLERLDVDGAEVTGEGLQALAGLERLRILNLHQTRIDAAGLRHLAAFRKLEMFRAGGPGAREPGIGHYYRVEGPTFVIELCNTQPDSGGNPANHVHTVYRSLKGDFAVAAAE
jgi:hypothetical protein